MPQTYEARMHGERVRWGDAALAQLYGSDAQAYGTDPAAWVLEQMRAGPEALDVPGYGDAQTVAEFLGVGATEGRRRAYEGEYGPLDGSEAPEPAAEPSGTWRIPGVGTVDGEQLGRRFAVGSLGVLLVVVGVLALLFGPQTVNIVKGSEA